MMRETRTAADVAAAWRGLERTHIMSQPVLVPHAANHGSMLRFAFGQRNFGDVLGKRLRPS